MPKDLRSYIKYLEGKFPEEFVRIKKPVDPKWEISAVIRKFQEENKYPAVLFENVKGYEMPVISNLFASRVRLAATFETTVEKATEEYIKREDNLLKPRIVNSGPVKDVIHIGDKADLSKLPIVTHAEKDSGPFLTPTIGITKDPDTGIYNTGMYRMEYKGPRRLGNTLGEYSHAAHIFRKMEKKGKDLDFAVALGHHPAVCHGTQSRVPLDIDELEVTGGLLGEPLEVVKAETVDLLVPAYAEIVIEGKVLANVRDGEGPFGEYTWYYGPQRQSPVLEVTAITHRKDAIFHDLHSPYIDHNYCGVLGRESVLFKRVKQVVPTVKAVAIPESGCCRHIAYVQIEKEFDGQGKNAALAALASDPFIKIAVVVDEDVNIFQDREVLWAITTRTQPDRDFFFVPEADTCALLPTAYTVKSRIERNGMDTKVGIDATKPVGLPFPEKSEVRDWQMINLQEYISES